MQALRTHHVASHCAAGNAGQTPPPDCDPASARAALSGDLSSSDRFEAVSGSQIAFVQTGCMAGTVAKTCPPLMLLGAGYLLRTSRCDGHMSPSRQPQ